MTPQNRNEFLSLVLLATMIGVVLGRVATALSAPFSTPMNFVLRDDERRDGPSSLDAGRTPGEVILRLAFAGDIMQHRQQAHDDFGASYEQLAPMLAAADIAAGNLEFPVDTTRPVGPPPSSVQFNGSPGHVAALAAAGFDVLSTANNHCFDQGADGLARTQQVLTGLGLTPVGSATDQAKDRPVIIERNGLRLGFYAYTFRPNSYADASGELQYWKSDWPVHELNFGDWSAEYRAEGLELIARHVRAAQEARVDWLVAVVHWGREWHFQPTADQRLAGRDLVDWGFDLVVGSHSHVVNPVEVYRNRLIAYSLGNLISAFRPWQARTGAVLQVELARTAQGELAIADFRAIPVVTESPGHRVRPVHASRTADEEYRALARKVLGPACIFAQPSVSAR